MPSLSNRDLKELSQLRFEESKILYNARSYSGAYYISGYAIEMAFKAIISKQFRENVFPDKWLVRKLYQHDLQILANVSGLSQELQNERQKCDDFDVNWAVVVNWSPEERYSFCDPFKAGSMIEAVGNVENGVLQWLKSYW